MQQYNTAPCATCHEITSRLTPGTPGGCRVSFLIAHVEPSNTRPYAGLWFAVLVSLRTSDAQRPMVNRRCSAWAKTRRVVQRISTRTKITPLGSQLFSRHAPHAQQYAMHHDRSISGWAVLGTLTLSLLGSSLRPRTVPINQRSSKAVRRMRTTLRQHGTLGMRGVPDGSHALHRLGLPSCKANHAVSRWRRKPCRHVPTLCTLLISSPISRARNKDTATIKIRIFPFIVSFRNVSFRNAVVVQPHTTKSVTRGVLSTFPAVQLYQLYRGVQ